MTDKCRVCGEDKNGIPFDDWVRPTFNNWDKLKPGTVICDECLFWFRERSEDFAKKLGKEKPQTMRNYSHFIKNGVWTALSKAQKPKMVMLLLKFPFPEMAAIAESGQKHIAGFTRRNLSGNRTGWVQFEEQPVHVDPSILKPIIDTVERLLSEFSKREITTGKYYYLRMKLYGIHNLESDERLIKKSRGSLLFQLAIFLAQKKEAV